MQGTQWFKLDELELWEANPNEGDIGAIINSINEFGYNDVLAVWRGKIKGGNHRVMGLRQLLAGGYTLSEQDTQARQNGSGYEVTGMDVSHLSERDADRFALALNRTARLGHDNPAQLATLLQEIAAEDERLLAAIGYDAEYLDELLKELNPHFEPGSMEDQPRLDELQPVICPHCGKNIRDET
jgi:hypothetical protein